MFCGDRVLHHKYATCESVNSFLLSPPPDRDIMSASNPPRRSSQTERQGVSFGEFFWKWIRHRLVSAAVILPCRTFFTRSRNAYDRQSKVVQRCEGLRLYHP